jgi:hypothetical protein
MGHDKDHGQGSCSSGASKPNTGSCGSDANKDAKKMEHTTGSCSSGAKKTEHTTGSCSSGGDKSKDKGKGSCGG